MARTAVETRWLAHDESPPLQLVKSRGSVVTDARGKRYVDFLMGWCVGNFGWGNAVLEKAAAKYRGPDYVYPGFAYPEWGELARMLLAIAPRGLAKCFRATGGSEAVDLAMQAAMVHTGRRGFLSIEDSYHGNTLATLSVGASANREKREKNGSFYSTYGWHPRSTHIAIHTLRYLTANRKRLLANVAETSAYFRDRLQAMDFGSKSKLRIVGLAIGIDLGDEKRASRLAERCRKNGLLISDEGETVLLIPALDIDRPTAKRGLDILERCAH